LLSVQIHCAVLEGKVAIYQGEILNTPRVETGDNLHLVLEFPKGLKAGGTTGLLPIGPYLEMIFNK